MRFWRVTFNKCYYEYDAFVVASESADGAVSSLRERFPEREEDYGKLKEQQRVLEEKFKGDRYTGEGEVDWSGGYTVEELTPDLFPEGAVVLGSYNAG